MAELRWVPTEGRKPRTGEKLLHLRFRNGLESKQPYIVKQINRWDHRGDDWDVTHVARVDDTPDSKPGAAWTPVSGGY